MKTFSFISGNKADATRGMQLVINRRELPGDAALGVWLDDDGKAMPGFDRPARRRAAEPRGPACEFVLLDRTRVRAKFGAMEGVLTLEPGTRFDGARGQDLGDVRSKGGELIDRGGRRFGVVREQSALFEIDRRAHEAHVFTLEAERPFNAKPGQRYRVDVIQRSATGVVVGGLTVAFVFD